MPNKLNWYKFQLHLEQVQSIIKEVSDKNLKLVILIGDSDAGKSTTINLLKDVQMELDDNNNLIPKAGQSVFCEIGTDSEKSCTMLPKLIVANDARLGYLDLPGFLHADAEEASYIATTVPLILKNADVNGILVVIDSGILGKQKGRPFKDFSTRLNKLIKLDALRQHLYFAFTKVANERLTKNKINQDKNNTQLSGNLIRDENTFFIHAEDPNVVNLRESLDSLVTQPTIPKESQRIESTEVSEFHNLAQRAQAIHDALPVGKSAVVQALLKGLYSSLVTLAKAFHLVVTQEVHAPDMDILKGNGLRIALSQLIALYSDSPLLSAAAKANDFPQRELKQFLQSFREFRVLLSENFNEMEEQSRYFGNMFRSLKVFTNEFKNHKADPERMGTFIDSSKKVGAVNSGVALLDLRNHQDLVEANALPEINNQTNEYQASKSVLEALDRIKANGFKLNPMVARLLYGYLKFKNKNVDQFRLIDPLFFYKTAERLFAAERQQIAARTLDVIDANSTKLNKTLDIVTDNKKIIDEISQDENFFKKLIEDYTKALTEVAKKQSEYIVAYQDGTKSNLDAQYSGGNNSAPATLDLLGKPSDFVVQFKSYTINKLPGGVVKPYLEKRYDAHYHSREISLSKSGLIKRLKNEINSKVTGGEYLQLVSFTKAVPTKDVQHAEIPYGRDAGWVHQVMRTVRADYTSGHKGICGTHGDVFLEGDLTWNIHLDLQSNRGIEYTLDFQGSYKGISVDAAYTRLGKNEYADPGGDCGFHWRLRNEMPLYVSQRWNNDGINKKTIKRVHDTPDIDGWFVTQRGNIEKGLRKFEGDHQAFLTAYKTSLFNLDLAVLKLRFYSQLIGKPLSAEILQNLITSREISNEIKVNSPNVNCRDLTPSLTAAIASAPNLVANGILNLPIECGISHPLIMLAANANLLRAQLAWRNMQSPLPRFKQSTPATDFSIRQHLHDQSIDADLLEISNRNLVQRDVVQMGRWLREHSQLQKITLKNTGLTTEQFETLLTGISVYKLNLTSLDCSYNPKLKESTKSIRALADFILTQKQLSNIDLSYTAISSGTLKVIATALANNIPLKTINLLNINLCTDDVALDLLASLYLNTELADLKINPVSVNSVISDAIEFFMKHKKENAATIPTELQARLDYFDTLLKSFCDKRYSAELLKDIPKKDIVFPSITLADKTVKFSLQGRAKKLQLGNKNIPDVTVISTPTPAKPVVANPTPVKPAIANPAAAKPTVAKPAISIPAVIHASLFSHSALQFPANSVRVSSSFDPKIPGFNYIAVEGDGNCLYYAVGLHLGFQEKEVSAFLRDKVAKYIRENLETYRAAIEGMLSPGQTIPDYIDTIRLGPKWADHLEIEVLQRIYNRPFVIHSPQGVRRMAQDENQYTGEPFYVYFNGRDAEDGHYDCLENQLAPLSRIQTMPVPTLKR